MQFAISTGHVTVLLVQLIRGFVTHGGIVGGPTFYFLDQATPEHLAQEAFTVANVSDGFSRLNYDPKRAVDRAW